MNLHEQYEALIALGMPEHPRVWTAEYGAAHFQSHYNCAVSDKDYDAAGGYFDDDDARDLLVQHALRWALKKLGEPRIETRTWRAARLRRL